MIQNSLLYALFIHTNYNFGEHVLNNAHKLTMWLSHKFVTNAMEIIICICSYVYSEMILDFGFGSAEFPI